MSGQLRMLLARKVVLVYCCFGTARQWAVPKTWWGSCAASSIPGPEKSKHKCVPSPSVLLWSSRASAALLNVVTLRPVRLSSRNTLLSLLPSMMDPSAVRLGADSTNSGREMGSRCGGRTAGSTWKGLHLLVSAGQLLWVGGAGRRNCPAAGMHCVLSCFTSILADQLLYQHGCRDVHSTVDCWVTAPARFVPHLESRVEVCEAVVSIQPTICPREHIQPLTAAEGLLG